MNVARFPQSDIVRHRSIFLFFALAALGLGVFAALGSAELSITVFVFSAFGIAALVLPWSWVVLTLACLIPLQIYIPFGGSLNFRGALVFVVVALLRVLTQQFPLREYKRWIAIVRSVDWIIPAGLFIAAAFVAASTALNRYEALKGIYLWLPTFATALVIGQTVHSESLAKKVVAVLIVGGLGEAVLGIIESSLDVPRVVQALRSPLSPLVFQPNILRDRLSDLSFNWIFNERVLSFGTFINNIDYAIFLAVILTLVLALMLGEEQTSSTRHLLGGHATLRMVFLLLSAILIGIALLETTKGSGIVALAGGIAAIVLLNARRVSSRLLVMGFIGLAVLLLVAILFSGEIAARVLFLFQRETGAFSSAGRVATWIHLLGFVAQRPLFGYGLNNTPFLLDWVPSLSGGTFVLNAAGPESAYIAILVETGIAGFVAFGSLVFVVLANAFRDLTWNRAPGLVIGLFAAVVAFLLGNLTVVGLTTDQNGMLFGALIGLICSSALSRRSVEPVSDVSLETSA